MKYDLKQLQEKLSVSFRSQQLLKQAFTHASYVNEQRSESLKDNERLEFLGDAVLEVTISEYLFAQYPDKPEGELTKMRAAIVCEPSLVQFAEQLGFGKYVFLGKGEEQTGGRMRPALLADVFESFVGALYLDQGLAAVQSFLHRWVLPQLTPGAMQIADYKTTLQEVVQNRELGTLEYRIAYERGPAHEREFVSEVSMDGQLLGTGSGKSKKEAEQQAAAVALEALQVAGRKAESSSSGK